MRLKTVELRGITRFGGVVRVDYDELPPGLVAIVGPNGAGKTTLMEAVPGGLYKTFPSRPGSLYDHAHGRDAFIHLGFEDDEGHLIGVEVMVDAEGRKSEGYLMLDGQPLTTGRAADFDAEIAKRFGSYDLFMASVFAAQNKAGSFLLMPKGDRKAIFVELLGISKMEAIATVARTHRTREESELEASRRVVATLEEQAKGSEPLEAAIEAMKAALLMRRDELEHFEAKLAEAVAAVEKNKSARDEAHRLEAEITKLEGDRTQADKIVRGIDAQIGANEVAQKRVRADLGLARELAEQPFSDADERLALASSSMERARAGMEREAEIAKNIAGVTFSLKERRNELQFRKENAEAERGRNTHSAALLEDVPCTTAEEWRRAVWTDGVVADGLNRIDLAGTCPLLAAAREAKAAVVVDSWPELEAEIARLEDHLVGLDSSQTSYPGTMREVYDAARKAAEKAREDQQRDVAIRAAGARVEALEQRVEDLGRERMTLAESRDREVGAGIALLDRIMELRSRVLALMDGLDPAAGDLESAQDAKRKAQDDLQEARAALVRAEADLMGRLVAAAKAGDERAIGEGHAREASEWGILEQAFGRDGIQALEIDAAGPEVAAITNALLEACYGARFSLGFETLREKKSARGEFTEAFDVKVYDGGYERAVESLSGGEKVVIGEALGLAFSIFNARKSGIRWRTIFRDETAGALDPRNAQAYVEMLRRALELGGFHQAVFVSHQQEVWERADARIDLGPERERAGSERVLDQGVTVT